MPTPLLELLSLSSPELLAIAAGTARRALAHWPDEWADYREALDGLVTVLEVKAGVRRAADSYDRVRNPLPLSDGAFQAIRRAVGPSRRAVLAIDAIRSSARAFQQAPDRAPAREVHDAVAGHVHEGLRLLEELDEFGTPDDSPGGGFGFGAR